MFGILDIVIHINTISILGPGATAMGYRCRNGLPPPNRNGLPQWATRNGLAARTAMGYRRCRRGARGV